MSGNRIDAARLKARLKAAPPDSSEQWRTRLHRAISWLARAEAEPSDHDARFIFLWIAFNAAYAREFGHEERERDKLRQFIGTLLELDRGQALGKLLFAQFSGAIRTLLENRYVFDPFWRALREHDAGSDWESRFIASRKVAATAVLNGDTATVLSIVFDRLYVLRNQLVHGGATWNSRVNRAQVRDGAAIMSQLVPQVIALMLEHPDADFGGIAYEVVPDL